MIASTLTFRHAFVKFRTRGVDYVAQAITQPGKRDDRHRRDRKRIEAAGIGGPLDLSDVKLTEVPPAAAD